MNQCETHPWAFMSSRGCPQCDREAYMLKAQAKADRRQADRVARSKKFDKDPSSHEYSYKRAWLGSVHGYVHEEFVPTQRRPKRGGQ